VITEAASKTEYVCRYCEKKFTRESTLAVHLCEQKRRYQQQNETGVKIGMQAYLRFYEITQGSAKLKTYDDFAASSYYRAFVKFGRYCQDIRAINIPRFIDWLLKNNKKLDHWCRDSIYTEYLTEYVKTEAATDALTRAIEYSIEWEEKTGNPARDCLRYGNDNALCYAVQSGRLSPWVLYNSDSGVEFLNRLNSDQVSIVWASIDPEYWQKRFRDYPADTEYVKEILRQAGW